MRPAYIAIQFAIQLPLVAVPIVGLVLLAVRRAELPSRTMGLGVAGCVVLLGGALGNLIWRIVVPFLGSSVVQIAWSGTVIQMLSVAAQATGVGLLVAAVLASRRPEAPPGAMPTSSISTTPDS